MDILNKPIDTFKFEDIVAFCKQGKPEGVQIDYKEDFPKNGFAKFFASFSNTRGGVIIIGVKEDKKSGVPIAWEGVVKDAKQIEKIHQQACDVEPIPSYQIHTTDEVEGKCFVLIRINEGDKTPYYVQNDSNVWIRTGNVSTPIGIASPDWLELLFGKREKAEKARTLYLEMAEEAYNAGLEREEKKRQKVIREAEEKKEDISRYFQHKLGTNVVLCKIVMQPYFPQRALATPREIKEKLNDFRLRNNYTDFPGLNTESIPEGIFNFAHSAFDGYIECQQIFSQGLIYKNFDVLRTGQDGKRVVNLWFIAANLFVIFQFAKKMYNHFGYQGVLEGFVSLKDVDDIYIRKLIPSGWHSWDNERKNFLPNFNWTIRLDTNILNDSEALKEYFVSLMHDIYWSFGYEEKIQDELIQAFLKESGFSF